MNIVKHAEVGYVSYERNDYSCRTVHSFHLYVNISGTVFGVDSSI